MSDEDLSGLDELDEEELDDEDLEALEAELEAMGADDDEEDEELDEEELARLEAEVAEMEDEMGELTDEEEEQDFEESGNMFVGALLRPKYASLMSNLEEELKREAEAAKTRPRGSVPKYLVNPFALPNRFDYEEIFDEIDPEEPDLKIWVMDNFEPVPVPLKMYGKFYSADCYVILYITEQSEGGVVINIHHWIGEQASPDKYGAAAFRAVELNMYMGGRCHIYRELEGRESQRFVDYFEGRLQYLVGGTAVGFKHVEPNSPKEHKPSLYQLIPQSSGQLVMKLVELSVQSLDSEFIFILDAGKRIFQWNGRFVYTKYRHWATAHAYTIRSNERGGKASVIVFNEGDVDEMLTYEEDIFWRYLGGRKEPLPPDAVPAPRQVVKRFVFEAEDAEDLDEAILAVSVAGSWDNFYEPVPMIKGEYGWDLEIPLKVGAYTYQYRVATASGVKPYCDMVRETTQNHLGEVNLVKAVADLDQFYTLFGTSTNSEGKFSLKEIDFGGYLERRYLTTENAYILDAGTEVFIWVGRLCKPLEKQVAMAVAKKIYSKYERPDWAPILGVYETAETTTFTSKFVSWDHVTQRLPGSALEDSKRLQSGKRRKQVRFTLASIVNAESYLRESSPDDEAMLDSGEGTVEVRLFTLKDGASQVAIPPHAAGVFFTESCYIVLYKYQATVRGRAMKKFMVYFWSGLGCKTTNAAFAKFVMDFLEMLLDRVGPGRISSMLVREGKEPKHFMRLFQGRIVIKRGPQQTYARHFTSKALYHVFISSHLVGYPRTHIYEVEPTTASLVSVRCFLLFTPEEMFIWTGQSIFPEELDIARGLLDFVRKTNYHAPCAQAKPVVVKEQEATTSAAQRFYGHLTGSVNEVCTLSSCHGRLYAVTFESGFFELVECKRYTQYDLVQNKSAALLLHTDERLFVWSSPATPPYVLAKAHEVAQEWVQQVATMQGAEEPVQEIIAQQQGHEDPLFQAFFPGWQNEYDREAYFDEPTTKRQELARSLETEFVTLSKLQKELDCLQDQIELLELISSSSEYSRAEEKAADPASNRVTVSFDEELYTLGLKQRPAPPKEDKLQLLREGVQPGEFLFEWSTSQALAVVLKGSWNEWQQTPLVNYGKGCFATKLTLHPGRYYYYYVVATDEGALSRADDVHPTTIRSVEGEEREVNILRVFTCTHPTYLEAQRKAEQDAEEAKRKAEEEANRVLTADELRKRERDFKEQQRLANEERLRRQLEEKRRNRMGVDAIVTDDEDDDAMDGSPITHSLMERKSRVPRRARTSILDEASATRQERRRVSEEPTAEEATTPSRSSAGGSSRASTDSSEDKSSNSYRERRRQELGLGSAAAAAAAPRASSPKRESLSSSASERRASSTRRSESLLDRLEDKLDSAISSSSSRSTRTTSPTSRYASSSTTSRYSSSASTTPSTTRSSVSSTSATRTRVTTDRTSSPTRVSVDRSSYSSSATSTPSTRATTPARERTSRTTTSSSTPSTPSSSSASAEERERKRQERRRALGLE